MVRKNGLPRRVYIKHGAFYFVDMAHKWIRLSPVADGMPGMYRALAQLDLTQTTAERMPAVLAKWMKANHKWGTSRRRNVEQVASILSAAFADFAPRDITTPDVAEYLSQYHDRPPSHNMHRGILRQAMSHAALLGLREGFNPVDDVKALPAAFRRRIVLDSEVEAIKKAGSPQLGRAIDLALLTGQRVGDLLALRWQSVTDAGLLVTQSKTQVRLCIEWSPLLRAAVAACASGTDKIGHVIKTSSGGGYTYAGMHSAWERACSAAGVVDLHFHDLRGRAGVDVLEASGLESARQLLGHRTQGMTAHYTGNKSVSKVKPSR